MAHGPMPRPEGAGQDDQEAADGDGAGDNGEEGKGGEGEGAAEGKEGAADEVDWDDLEL